MLFPSLRNLKDFTWFAVCLALALALLCLPYIQFSRAHVHLFDGVLVAHWHPVSAQDTGKSKTPAPFPQNPGHSHSLGDIVNLQAVQNNQGLPEIQALPCIEQEATDYSPPIKETIFCKIFISIPTGRSPPVMVLT